jgi:hypothetical protein
VVGNKVVIKFKDKKVLKGTTNNFFPNKNSFHLEQLSGERLEIRVEDLKAIFFVKTYDGDKRHEKSYADKVLGGGRRITVHFADGETIAGFTTGYSPGRPGFYMVPADLKGNNERVYVVSSATQSVEMG